MKISSWPEHKCEQYMIIMEGETGDLLIKRMYIDGKLREPSDVLKILKEFTVCARESSFREALTAENICFLTEYMQQSVEALSSQKLLFIECCIECLRCLRNACAHCVENQDAVLVSSAKAVVRQLLRLVLAQESLEEPYLVLLRCCIQFLTNLASGHEEGQRLVWKDIHDLVHPLLSVLDKKVTQYCCMLLQTLLECPDNSIIFTETVDALEIMEAVLVACSAESDHEFCLCFVQFTLQSSVIIPPLFDKLSIAAQILLLHVAGACIETDSQHQGPDMVTAVSEATLTCFAQKFKSIAHSILALAMKDSNQKDQNSQLVMSLLDVLCAASTERNLQACLQNMDFLLETSLELLDMVEQVGRSSKNVFSVQQDITAPADDAAIAATPAYGFKRNLVQLVGNMCYRHRGNQDRVRELKGIPTILQQCNIDSKNAFINQWAIFAIRNLCENNHENQAVLLSLKNEGVADNEALARLGYEAAVREDGRIYLKNLKK